MQYGLESFSKPKLLTGYLVASFHWHLLTFMQVGVCIHQNMPKKIRQPSSRTRPFTNRTSKGDEFHVHEFCGRTIRLCTNRDQQPISNSSSRKCVWSPPRIRTRRKVLTCRREWHPDVRCRNPCAQEFGGLIFIGIFAPPPKAPSPRHKGLGTHEERQLLLNHPLIKPCWAGFGKWHKDSHDILHGGWTCS